MFTGLEEHHCVCEKRNRKPVAAPEKAACDLINSHSLCHSGIR